MKSIIIVLALVVLELAFIFALIQFILHLNGIDLIKYLKEMKEWMKEGKS